MPPFSGNKGSVEPQRASQTLVQGVDAERRGKNVRLLVKGEYHINSSSLLETSCAHIVNVWWFELLLQHNCRQSVLDPSGCCVTVKQHRVGANRQICGVQVREELHPPSCGVDSNTGAPASSMIGSTPSVAFHLEPPPTFQLSYLLLADRSPHALGLQIVSENAITLSPPPTNVSAPGRIFFE